MAQAKTITKILGVNDQIQSLAEVICVLPIAEIISKWQYID